MQDQYGHVYLQYKLYNTETKQVEETRTMTEAAARASNHTLEEKREPKRWVFGHQ